MPQTKRQETALPPPRVASSPREAVRGWLTQVAPAGIWVGVARHLAVLGRDYPDSARATIAADRPSPLDVDFVACARVRRESQNGTIFTLPMPPSPPVCSRARKRHLRQTAGPPGRRNVGCAVHWRAWLPLLRYLLGIARVRMHMVADQLEGDVVEIGVQDLIKLYEFGPQDLVREGAR